MSTPRDPSGWSVGEARAHAAFHLSLAAEQSRRLLTGDAFAQLQHKRDPEQFRGVIRHHLERAKAWRQVEQRARRRADERKVRELRDRLAVDDFCDRWATVRQDGRPVATLETRRVYDREAPKYRLFATDGRELARFAIYPTRFDIARALIRGEH